MKEMSFGILALALFISLADPTLSRAGNYAVIANAENDSISVLNPFSNTQYSTPATISIEQLDSNAVPKPKGVAVSPDGKHIFVANPSDNSLTVLEIDSMLNVRKQYAIKLNNLPTGVAITALGNLVLVAGQDPPRVSLLNTGDLEKYERSPGSIPKIYLAPPKPKETTTSLTTSEVDPEDNPSEKGPIIRPRGIVASPDSKFAYVANYADRSLSVLNLEESGTEPYFTLKEIGAGPYGVAISPKGDRVYITNRNEDTVSIVDTSKVNDITTIKELTNISSRIKVGSNPMGIAVSADGKLLYVANYGSYTISAIELTTTEQTQTTIPVGMNPMGVALSPDGKLLYVTGKGDMQGAGVLSAIDTTSLKVVRSIALNSTPASFGKFAGQLLVPTPPGELEATATSDDQIKLTWNDTSGDTTEFAVERMSDQENQFTLLATLGKDARAYTDDDVEEGTTYVYRVKASNNWGGPAISSVTESTPPNAPTDLTTKSESSLSITLNWKDNSEREKGYAISRAEGDSKMFQMIAEVKQNITSYIDQENIKEDTEYSYKVSLFSREISGQDDPSLYFQGETQISTALTPLAPPTDLTGESLSHEEVRLSWKDHSQVEEGYIIESRTIPSDPEESATAEFKEIAKVPQNTTTCTIAGLTPYTVYQYRIRAFRGTSTSNYSEYSDGVELKTSDKCFIATAAYGSLIEPHVATLRQFRDLFLIPNKIGRSLVDIYYKYSPPIADLISRHSTLRAIVRAMLWPMVGVSHVMLALGPLAAARLLCALALISFFFLFRRYARSQQ